MFNSQGVADRGHLGGRAIKRHIVPQPRHQAEIANIAWRVRRQLERQPDIDLGKVGDLHLRGEHTDDGEEVTADLHLLSERGGAAAVFLLPIAVREQHDRRGAGVIVAGLKHAPGDRWLSHRGEQVAGRVTDVQGSRLTVLDQRGAAFAEHRDSFERGAARAIVQVISRRHPRAGIRAARVRPKH